VRFNLELKRLTQADADIYLPALIAYDADCGGCLFGRLTVQCFSWPTLQYARATYHADGGGSALAFDVSLLAIAPSLAELPAAAAYADVLSPSFEQVTPDVIAAAHALSLRVVPWTVNEPAAMDALLQMGVDGLITDDPKTLLRLLGR
jgi:glycerophosphoryl diester phosphodiesterase